MTNQTAQSTKTALRDYISLSSLLRGIIVSCIITLPVFVLFALVLSNMDFPERYIPTVVLITTVISIIIAGSTATKNVKSRGWLNGSIVGIIYILILYLLSSIVYRDFSISRHMLSMLALGILSGAIGGIIGINLKRNQRTRVRH